MKEKDKQKIADAIEDQKPQRPGQYPFASDLPRKPVKTYEEIALTKRIDIPSCKKIPVNGRIFLIESAGSETKTEAGLILPHKFRSKKGEEMAIKDVNRYFVVRWDSEGIPKELCDKLHVGIEVSPFLPQEAEEWSLPIIVDFETGNQFLVAHYTEICGISETLPEAVE